jgi:hypothetical protein
MPFFFLSRAGGSAAAREGGEGAAARGGAGVSARVQCYRGAIVQLPHARCADADAAADAHPHADVC